MKRSRFVIGCLSAVLVGLFFWFSFFRTIPEQEELKRHRDVVESILCEVQNQVLRGESELSSESLAAIRKETSSLVKFECGKEYSNRDPSVRYAVEYLKNVEKVTSLYDIEMNLRNAYGVLCNGVSDYRIVYIIPSVLILFLWALFLELLRYGGRR